MYPVPSICDVLTGREGARRKVVEKPEKEVMAEIQAIVRQITASVTFLPLLNDPCAPSPLLTAPSPCPRAPCPIPHRVGLGRYILSYLMRIRIY